MDLHFSDSIVAELLCDTKNRHNDDVSDLMETIIKICIFNDVVTSSGLASTRQNIFDLTPFLSIC